MTWLAIVNRAIRVAATRRSDAGWLLFLQASTNDDRRVCRRAAAGGTVGEMLFKARWGPEHQDRHVRVRLVGEGVRLAASCERDLSRSDDRHRLADAKHELASQHV